MGPHVVMNALCYTKDERGVRDEASKSKKQKSKKKKQAEMGFIRKGMKTEITRCKTK